MSCPRERADEQPRLSGQHRRLDGSPREATESYGAGPSTPAGPAGPAGRNPRFPSRPAALVTDARPVPRLGEPAAHPRDAAAARRATPRILLATRPGPPPDPDLPDSTPRQATA
ncbi:hypothetical protein AB0383_19765 [Amycolatopsis sp. NPDC051373]|uniref:hypothetical protein n=1 Tax=Amycolatopsis sp. NPDC051373 TaxID=3155801 RepID=UPI00344C570B